MPGCQHSMLRNQNRNQMLGSCFLAGNLSGGEANLAYELLNIQQSIDGLMSILSLFIIHVALVHVRIE